MVGSSIIGYTRNRYKKLCDKVGALEKSVKLKRMEPYADVIDKVFRKYNQDDSKKTMMYKLFRDPVKGTTQRGKHEANVVEVAGKIADGMDWLNSDITRLMAKHHDIGHTFLGHSGEWWLAEIKNNYAMGYCVHNALGPRKLMYRNDVETEIEEAIREKEPDIAPKKLAKIKRDLWLVLDGINCHNGERSEYSYEPDFSKSRSRFERELRDCYVKHGADIKLVPATAEGSLMRLSDKISYIPFDMVDIFRNGCNLETYTTRKEKADGTVEEETYNFYDEYRKQLKILGMPDDSLDRLLQCKTEKDYDDFAREIQRILIADVKKSSRRNNIRMSEKVARAMHDIRKINNRLMVDYVVTAEDQEVHPQALENLVNKYAQIVTGNGLINLRDLNKSAVLSLKSDPENLAKLKRAYAHMPDVVQFIDYISQTPERDLEFTADVVDRAFEFDINEELEYARVLASNQASGVEIKINAMGDKKNRIDTYLQRYSDDLEVAYEHNIVDRESNSHVNSFRRNVWTNKTKKALFKEVHSYDPMSKSSAGVKTPEERVAMEMAIQFLSSLNDEQYKQLLIDSKEVDEATMASLTRPYQSFDFRAEAKPHRTWTDLTKSMEKQQETEKKSGLRDFFGRKKKQEKGEKQR